MIMQKMMDCNIIEEIKGKQNKLHVVFATFCRTEVKVIGTWKKHTNSNLNSIMFSVQIVKLD